LSPPLSETSTPRGRRFSKLIGNDLAATDFFTIEVCTIKGLVTHYVLFFIDVASRAVKIAGITPHPDNRWMTQIARNLTDPDDGFLRGKRYLILDRDTKYSDAFGSVLIRDGIHVIRLPPKLAQFECFRRAVRAFHQRGMFEPHDLLRAGIASARDPAVHDALPH
jgi:hypothetical protein